MNKPKLRPVEVLPFEHEGRRAVLLRDPMQLRPGALAIPAEAAPILMSLDGRHTPDEIRERFTQATGAILRAEDLQGLLAKLDEALLLEGDHFRSERARIVREFHEAPFRATSHAGLAYPENAKAYRAVMAPHLDRADPAADRVTAILSPHIDYERGAGAYGRAFAGVPVGRFARVVILGTSHHGDMLYAVTDKDHATPFGRLPADREFLARLESRHDGDLRAGEFFHRDEHSVELNAVLVHMLAGREIPLVPILCGSFHELVAAGESPRDRPEIVSFLDALAATLAESPGDSLLVAAADLAHVGPRFGDAEHVDEAGLASVEAEDRASLRHAAAADADGFYRSVAADGDRRKVCGLSPIYALLSLIPGAAGTLLDYRQCPDPQPGSFVSIAAMTFRPGA